MSDQDVAAVRRLFETQDLEEALEVLDPAIEVRDFDIPDADTYRGHDGYRRWLANWMETFPETSIELEEILDSGDRVVVIIRVMARGRGSGIELERRDGMVWTMREGRVVAIEYYGSAEEALKAAGLQ